MRWRILLVSYEAALELRAGLAPAKIRQEARRWRLADVEAGINDRAERTVRAQFHLDALKALGAYARMTERQKDEYRRHAGQLHRAAWEMLQEAKHYGPANASEAAG